MKHDSSTKSWNQVGQEGIDLMQINESRLCFIMPYMLDMIGDVSGKKILDLGCGEGGYSRKLAEKGADVTAVDCSEYFIDFAIKQAKLDGLNILHYVYNSNDLHDIKEDRKSVV